MKRSPRNIGTLPLPSVSLAAPALPPPAPEAPPATTTAALELSPASPPPVDVTAALLEQLPEAVREVNAYPLRHLATLGGLTRVPITLVCEVVTSSRIKLLGQLVVMTTSQPAYTVARAKGLPIFLGRELFWLALGVEHDRIEPHHFGEWLVRKAADPQFRIDGPVAVGDITGPIDPKSWSCERVFRELGLRLVAVGVNAETPVFGVERAQVGNEQRLNGPNTLAEVG